LLPRCAHAAWHGRGSIRTGGTLEARQRWGASGRVRRLQRARDRVRLSHSPPRLTAQILPAIADLYFPYFALMCAHWPKLKMSVCASLTHVKAQMRAASIAVRCAAPSAHVRENWAAKSGPICSHHTCPSGDTRAPTPLPAGDAVHVTMCKRLGACATLWPTPGFALLRHIACACARPCRCTMRR